MSVDIKFDEIEKYETTELENIVKNMYYELSPGEKYLFVVGVNSLDKNKLSEMRQKIISGESLQTVYNELEDLFTKVQKLSNPEFNIIQAGGSKSTAGGSKRKRIKKRRRTMKKKSNFFSGGMPPRNDEVARRERNSWIILLFALLNIIRIFFGRGK
jgi:hypothetical protein